MTAEKTTIIIALCWIIFGANAIPIEKFYPFGRDNGDSQLETKSLVNADTVNGEITLKVPIKFYGDSYTAIYVNADGLLSFLTPLPTFTNTLLPLDYPVIAALYAHADLTASGRVFYRETQNEYLLNRATAEIRRAFPSKQFLATSLFVATWSKIGYYSYNNQGADKTNTFQVVIASNDSESFIELLFADDGIQWIQGISNPQTGLPDAKAQSGLVALNGRTYLLPGSGTDQIRNLMRLSNTNEAGVWIFRTGDIPSAGNVEGPDSQQIAPYSGDSSQRGESTCATGYSFCHSQATCVDTRNKYCCVCKRGFYGNGYNCLKDGVPLRATGKVNLEINSVRVTQQDLQAFIVVADGRVYAAMSKIPPSVGAHLQLLYPVTIVLNWLFAKSSSTGFNGFQITGGVLNHTAEIIYKDSSHRVSINQKYYGLDLFDHLKLEVDIRGSVPLHRSDDRILVNDYQTRLNLISAGKFRSSSTLTYNVTSSANEESEKQISLEQNISFEESCALRYNTSTGVVSAAQNDGQFSYYRVKTSRNFFSYEVAENILRFAATSKVSLLTENEDPCVEGRVKCVVNSSCVVEDSSFVCLCNTGFRATYSTRNTENRNADLGCLDVNECAEGIAACDSNAMCVNEIGAYQCICKPGYTGNGYQCAEIEPSPCERDPSLCNPPNSYCSDANDYRTCRCNSGYEKKYVDASQIGFTCVDINECESAVCSPQENCINLEGTYTCECKSAFAGSGRGCKQFVSCNEVNNCSPNAVCIFDESSQNYTCRCIPNYYGDGYLCKTYGGRRVVVKLCTDNGCICPPNFIQFDTLCVNQEDASSLSKVNQTVTCNVLTNMCHPHALCVHNSSNSLQYQCVCNVGYEGDGLECYEAEISCAKNDICDLHASCQINERTGKARCVCNNHYHGDGLHCEYYGICQTDNECGQNEECVYNDDTFAYECRCRKGFVRPNDGTCRPITTCSSCHQYARCKTDNITRDSACECLPGYRGDGVYNCDKIMLPCNVESNCSPYAKCELNALTNSYQCRCNQGFAGNGTYCEDVRTCAEAPELCDRNARCVVKLYNSRPQCECNTGFIGNGATCAEIPKYEGGFLFVNYGMTTLRVPYEPSVSNQAYPVQLQANQIAIGLTIDCQLARVYWSDYYGRKIKSSTFKGKNITVLVEKNITAIEGLTADWIKRVLYWVDSGAKLIESINLDGSQRKIVISKNLTNPRGIVVHPYRSKLFWSDWDRAHPKIEWSNADGTDRSIFLSGSIVEVPNSVAIDWFTDELCWADAGTKRITCANIETRQYRLITDSCVAPFGLAISTDRYYWTERMLGKIGYYDKKTRKAANMTVPLISSGALYDIVNVPIDCP